MELNQELKNQIVCSIQKVLGDNLIAIVLFGSKARNDETDLDSDYDIFILAKELPERKWDRWCYISKCKSGIGKKVGFIAHTKKEFEEHFPPLYLDIGLDGIVLYDTEDYIKTKLERIKEIIKEAGLKRIIQGKMMYWTWEKQPRPGHWIVDWEGFREF